MRGEPPGAAWAKAGKPELSNPECEKSDAEKFKGGPPKVATHITGGIEGQGRWRPCGRPRRGWLRGYALWLRSMDTRRGCAAWSYLVGSERHHVADLLSA